MRTVEPQPAIHSLYWLVFIFFIVLAGLIWLIEQAILSARKSRLDKLTEAGGSQAHAAIWALENQDTVLLAARLGLTAVCLVTGGLACLAPLLDFGTVSVLTLSLSGIIFVIALTGFALVFSLAERRLMVGSPEAVLLGWAWLPRLLAGLFLPLTWLSGQIATAVFRWFDSRRSQPADAIEEEVCLLLEQGAQDGVFEKAEQDMVERIFTLNDVRASALMTPRTQITWLDLEEKTEDLLTIVRQSGHSRFPVGRDSLDDVSGVVFAKDLLIPIQSGQKLELEQYIRTPVFVPKSMSGLRILELFKQSGTHIALVIDEYGGLLGLITINDIVEHIVGELPLADEPDAAMVVQRDDGSWLVDGMLPVEELKQLLVVESLPAEERENFQTAGGFVTSYLEHIPAASEFFIWQNWRFEVLDMDRSRIDKLLISRIPEPAVCGVTD